ncbi:PH domain-containing protein [Spongisporangium articulatum]|uniref:PH domain-containing protein n=1 Tax=Spongisporangium articulatum TaxID=3362603 RepID=A0ABW8ANG2_9ACTN
MSGETHASAARVPAPAEPGPWRRVHPLTPVIRSWRVLAVALVGFLHNGTDDLVNGRPPGLLVVAVIVGVAVGLLLLSSGILYVQWRFTRFRIGAQSVELYTGVLFRQHRSARLDRIQAVEVAQPFLARLVGLARLTVEVAGGSGSKIALQYLGESEALGLRAELLARSAGVEFEGAAAPEAPEHRVLEVPTPRLVAALLLSPATAMAAVIVATAIAAVVVVGGPGPLAALVPVLFGAVGVQWGQFNSGFGFTVGTSPDGLRLRHGLLEHRAQTVPPGRVQAVGLSQSPLWRPFGWWAIHVNVAGYAGDSRKEGAAQQVLLPVGTEREVFQLLELVLPDLGTEPDEHPADVVRAGLTGRSPDLGFVVAPRRAGWVDPLGWSRSGVRITREALLIRSGWLVRRLALVLHARTQSLALEQGPWQRRLRLAHFVVHSTPGPVRPVVEHLDAAVAARLLADQAERARHARSRSGPERWMEQLSAEGSDETALQPGESAE